MENTENVSYEYNSFKSHWHHLDADDFHLTISGLASEFSKRDIFRIIKDPIIHHTQAKRLANLVYAKNGIVTNAIDYMVALPKLDRMVVGKYKKNKDLMKAVLKTINDRSFIRDALFTEMNNGIYFYYIMVNRVERNNDKRLDDNYVESIFEVNDGEMNVTIITLPYEYTKIIGKRNGRYELAFNLEYFDQYQNIEERKRRLQKYPPEIQKAYTIRETSADGKNWVRLDNTKTLCNKIKCKDKEPWGRPLALAALEDILYRDQFLDTKRSILDDINNRVFYETFPEGKDKGTCALTAKQQLNQHETVKGAITNKNNRGGINFFSVAAGTKIDQLDVSTDIFDEKNESDLNNQIALDLGVCATLLGLIGGSNYSSQQSNLELILAKIYSWVFDIQEDLNYVINKSIIKNKSDFVEVSYFPTSLANSKDFFEKMKALYTDAGGSLRFLIASAGVDPDVYLKCLDSEIEEKLFDKYLPHQTSYTLSAKETASGRPATDDSTNVNTVKSKSNNSNNQPKPSV